MIPKIIHLCWFGKHDYPELVLRCIDSWKKKMPYYSIMLWNEDSFDINSVPWTKEAYSLKKWAFVSDYVRLIALYKYGGIYLDTDMEVLVDFSSYLDSDDFTCSFIEGSLISMGFIATPCHSPVVKRLIDYYDTRHFINEDHSQNTTMNTLIITKICVEEYGLKLGSKEFIGDGIHIYPFEFFMPYRKNLISNDVFRRKNYIITSNTLMIHHDSGSWDNSGCFNRLLRGFARLIIPSKVYLLIKKQRFARMIKGLILEQNEVNE